MYAQPSDARSKSKMASADKNVVGLLNGLARREYFGESEITDDFLHQELFPDLGREQFDAMLSRYENLMRNIVSADMDFNQLEAFLTSQTRRKQGSLTQEQAAAFLKFWKSQKVKIHDVLVQRSSWNNRLKDISWRIDLKSQGRHLQQINTPVAIVEMQVEKRSTENKVEYYYFKFFKFFNRFYPFISPNCRTHSLRLEHYITVLGEGGGVAKTHIPFLSNNLQL